MKLDCSKEETEAIPKADPMLFHPKTGKTLDPDDADELIDALELVKNSLAMCFTHKETIEKAICKHVAHLKTKTRRVQGERRKARVEMPSDKQSSSTLKVIAESKEHRLIWKQLIKISTYAIKMREYNKAKNTKGTEEWNAYRDAVTSAISPPTSNPRVIIEE